MLFLFLDHELLRGRAVAIMDLHIRALAIHTVAIVLDLHALVRVHHRADRLGHAVVDPFLGVGAVAVVQLDVVPVVGIAAAEVNAQVPVIAHLDSQAVEVPLFGRVGVILGPKLDVGA